MTVWRACFDRSGRIPKKQDSSSVFVMARVAISDKYSDTVAASIQGIPKKWRDADSESFHRIKSILEHPEVFCAALIVNTDFAHYRAFFDAAKKFEDDVRELREKPGVT